MTEKVILESLTRPQQQQIVRYITDRFDHLTTKKSQVLKDWDDVEETLRSPRAWTDFRSNTKIVPFHVTVHQTLLSHFWARSLQTPSMLFNVVGMDEESQKYAPLYKANLIDFLNQDKFQAKLNQILDLDAIAKGVCIGMIAYKERIDEKTIPASMFHRVNLGDIQDVETTADGMIRYRKKTYDGPTFKRINPYHFVFDSEDDWDNAFKAYREFRHWEDLKDAGIYDNLDEVKPSGNVGWGGYSEDSATPNDSTTVAGIHTEGYDKHGKVDCIHFFGDIRIPDTGALGKTLYLRNYMVTVGAKKSLIQFEPNPYMFNPFIKWQYRETEDGWGQSILKASQPLVENAAEVMSLGIEASKLAINPPCYAPEGMINESRIDVHPGTIIKYKVNPAVPNITAPTPVPINPHVPFEYLSYFETTIEAVTGATRQISGAGMGGSKDQTATEFSGLMTAGNMMLDRIVDLFNMQFKLPAIERFAQMLGYFNPVERDVLTENDSGSQKLQRIPANAYYGQYNFQIDDAKSEIERKGFIKEQLSFAQQLLQDPELAAKIKKVDYAQKIFADLGFGNPDSLFMTDQERVQHAEEELQVQAQIQQAQASMQGGQQIGQPGQPGQPSMPGNPQQGGPPMPPMMPGIMTAPTATGAPTQNIVNNKISNAAVNGTGSIGGIS